MALNSNGWGTKVGIGVLGATLGAGGLWLTRHDASVAQSARLVGEVQELMAFKAKINSNVEEWRGDQERMRALEIESKQAKKERRAMYRWMDTVSARLGVPPPVTPDNGR